MTQSNQPAFEINYGAVKATVWCNERETGTYYSIDLYRIYKDKDDQWKRSHSFGLQDLPKVEKAAAEAYQRIYALRGEQPNTDQDDS